jgi:sec-independent protein translocase protein TatB
MPEYARKLAQWVRQVRDFADNAKEQLSEELGEEVDWKSLDPRQYDPRRIIREALTDDGSSAATKASNTAAAVAAVSVAAATPARSRTPLQAGEAAPFDGEAT